MIFLRAIENEGQLLYLFTLKKQKIKKQISKIELFGFIEIVIKEAISKVKKTKEVKQKVGMHWSSGFCKQSQC